MINNFTSQTVVLEEKTVFELSRTGARGMNIPSHDVPKIDSAKHFSKRRKKPATLPEISEVEVVRHFTRLSTWNYAIDFGIYPLGSCTMKYNPRFNEDIARSAIICDAHPYDPAKWVQGHLQIMHELQEDLKEMTGMAAVSLQPAAGAQGEFAGLLTISQYHISKGKKRGTVLTADTSHGTNPASAALAGFKVVQLPTGDDGSLSLESVRNALNDDVAALMVTNPNTLGLFEKNIFQIAKLLHENDALLYIDGANMNAVLGISRPGDYGADVIQFNLHKTFTTPHGGGGPGSGPIAVSDRLKDFLPQPTVNKTETGFEFCVKDSNHCIGKIKSFYGNFGMFIRAWCYIKALGAQGLREVSENAILNANYIKAKLKSDFHIPVEGFHLHEVVFNDALCKEKGWDTTKIAKALLDYGMHPPTVHFPLCVKSALMIEPTETETIAEMDRFVDAMKDVIAKDPTTQYPTKTPRQKIDETKAARELKLVYQKD